MFIWNTFLTYSSFKYFSKVDISCGVKCYTQSEAILNTILLLILSLLCTQLLTSC